MWTARYWDMLGQLGCVAGLFVIVFNNDDNNRITDSTGRFTIAVRVACSHRLQCKTCVPHICVCGKAVSARGLHGFACHR